MLPLHHGSRDVRASATWWCQSVLAPIQETTFENGIANLLSMDVRVNIVARPNGLLLVTWRSEGNWIN